ncbi:MAG: 1-acyl-sn-glycerol-3-phosphate acyltransferase [Candidatus Omnitrophica bacterium]|nr:1-acyl-sn-glycerol-3-phosphate acyltransferase [Candidatus Omnitrophota bacterium]
MQKAQLSDAGELSLGLSAVLSAAAWIVFAFFTLLLFLSGVFIGMPLTFVFDRGSRRCLHTIARLWGRGLIFFCPLWSIRTEGLENLTPGRHYVVTANHQSLLDILVVLSGLPVHFKFMAKKELFGIPVMGWHMALAGYIPINRGNKDSAREAVASARNWVSRGVSVLFFPEGTRSPDGEIKAFKGGAFRVAVQEKTPILPCIIEGTGDALPKHSWIIRKKSAFRLYIGKPISVPEGEESAVSDALRESVHQEMTARLASIRSSARLSGGPS